MKNYRFHKIAIPGNEYRQGNLQNLIYHGDIHNTGFTRNYEWQHLWSIFSHGATENLVSMDWFCFGFVQRLVL